MAEHLEGQSRIDRRDLIKRGAVIGGLVWTAPVLQSLSSPAFAQATPLCQSGCFAVKVNRATDCPGATGDCEDLAPLPGGGQRFCTDCNNAPFNQSPGGCPCVHGSTTFEDCECGPNEEGAGSATVVLPAGCTFISGSSKCGRTGCSSATAVGNTITFPPCDGQCVSHIEFCYCCNN